MELALKHSQKPTVALIRSQGDSAAYEVATGANVIFASAESEVGDIGITESYTDNAKKDARDGLTFHQLSIGKYKDMLDPDKPLTPAEHDLIMSQLQVGYDRFVQMVADGRHMSTTAILKLADGSEVIGQTALAEGLIDKIGNVDDVRDYLTQKLKTPAVICSIDQ